MITRTVVALALLAQLAPGAAVTHARIDSSALMDTVRALAAPEMKGRRSGTAGGRKAREWVQARFAKIGLPPAGKTYLQPFRFTEKGATIDGANIASLCRGTRGTRVFVVSAHYDHLGVADGKTYFGADDNASGVAVLLELARLCRERPFEHTVVFVAFDAEEQGLEGAKAFVQSPPIPREQIALNVNLDMVARGDKGELYVAGTHHSPSLKPPLESVAAKAPIKLLFGHDSGGSPDDWTMQSDHGPFHKAGIPFVYFGVEDHPDYHKPTDRPDKIDAKFFGAAANTILQALEALDAKQP